MTAAAQPKTIRLGFDPEYLPAFMAKTFIEGPQTARRLTDFFVLLVLATVIATYGVLSDSTATVIGAMIVAPLMGPMIAITAAVVMGSGMRALRALALTVTGIVTVVILSYLLSWVVPDVTISFESNKEITSRINPGLYALLTALGAGAAGAYIVSRAEIADSMGGVAIAISLVPPLCVVGIALQKNQWAAAGGAFLLFMTNFLAILLAGGIVMLIVGLGRQVGRTEQARVRQRGFILFFVGILLVIVPLMFTTFEQIQHATENSKATAQTAQWLAGTAYQILNVNVSDRIISVSLEGVGELKPLETLANQISIALRRPVLVKLRVFPVQVGSSSTP